MSEMRQARVGRSEDDLNELMPMHSRKLAQAEDADGETVGLNEYLSSGRGNQSLGGIDWRGGFMQRDAPGINVQHAKAQMAPALPRGHTQMTAILEQGAGEPAEQENLPPNSDALTLYLDKARPNAKGRGLRKEGTGRVPQKKRTFGLDLRQLSRQQEGSDSEAEWEAGDEVLAKKKAERSARRKQEKEKPQRRQSAGGPRVSRGGAEDMELDSDDDGMDLGRDAEMPGIATQGQGEGEGGLAQRETVTAAAAWKTNPIFDDAWPEKQAAPEAHLVPSPAAPSPPKTNIAATTRTAATPSPTLTPPPQTTATVHPSLSAQARKLAEKVLKERADVSSKATAAHVVEAAHAAEDVDFPALEGSPPRVDSAGSGEDELVPGQVASKDAAEEEMRKREEGMPEVMEGPSEEPIEQPATSQAAAAAQDRAPVESRAVVRFAERKPVEKFRRIKSMLDKSRKSLAAAGLTIDHGVRRSTRARQRPLEWWRNESFDWERSHDSLPTISKVNLLSPDSLWPRNDGRKSVKSRALKAAVKRPALAITSG